MDYNTVSRRLTPHINTLNSMGVERLAVFGSVARGSTGNRSDLDILVRFEKNMKTFDNFMELNISVFETSRLLVKL